MPPNCLFPTAEVRPDIGATMTASLTGKLWLKVRHSITSSAWARSVRHADPEDLGSLEIDKQFEFGRLFDGEIGGFSRLSAAPRL